MEDIDKENILYSPDIHPKRNYQSIKDFIPEENIIPYPTKPKESKTPEDLIKEIDDAKALIKFLPQSVQFIAPSILDKLQDRLRVAYPDGKSPTIDGTKIPGGGTYYGHNPKPTQYRFYTPPKKPSPINTLKPVETTKNPALKKLPELFPKTVPVSLEVQEPKSLVQLIQDGYDKDTIRLDQYYLQKLQFIMQKYFQQMITVMAETGVSNIDDLTTDFDGKSVEVPKHQSMAHLRDHIVRSQISKDQKTRVFHKTHCTDQTLQHMRSWHISEKQRERYYGEKYGDSSTFTQSQSNALLRECRVSYDKNYSSTLYNMYKYLDSSVNLLNDVLEMTAKEGQAKSMLLQNGVDIFKTSKMKDIAKVPESAYPTAPDDDKKTDDNKTDGDKKDDDKKKEGDSGIKSPNGTDYTDNDIKYLTDQGYTKDDAVAYLATCDKYKETQEQKEKKEKEAEQQKKTQETKTTESSDYKLIIPGYSDANTYIKGNAAEIAPNGYHYANNDIEYLMKNGYDRAGAIEYLKKCPKYITNSKGNVKSAADEWKKFINKAMFVEDPTKSMDKLINMTSGGIIGNNQKTEQASTNGETNEIKKILDVANLIGGIAGGNLKSKITDISDKVNGAIKTYDEAKSCINILMDKTTPKKETVKTPVSINKTEDKKVTKDTKTITDIQSGNNKTESSSTKSNQQKESTVLPTTSGAVTKKVLDDRVEKVSIKDVNTVTEIDSKKRALAQSALERVRQARKK